jgi:hypothetical protein
MLLDLKRTETSQFYCAYRVTTSQDVGIFVLTTMTTMIRLITLPLTHARGVTNKLEPNRATEIHHTMDLDP